MKLPILILEDDPERVFEFYKMALVGNENVVVVNTAQVARDLLGTFLFKKIYLDHDLGGRTYAQSDENSGYSVAKLIPHSINHKTQVVIHSWNIPAAERMEDVMESVDNVVVRAPFGSFSVL